MEVLLCLLSFSWYNFLIFSCFLPWPISQMEYIKAQTKPKDGRLLAIGHSMGGILLYAMLARYSKLDLCIDNVYSKL